MRPELSQLRDDLVDLLGPSLIGLLLIGSEERQDETVFSDVDLVLVGDQIALTDYGAMRELVRNLSYFVDLAVVLRRELPDAPESFQMGAQGCYFVPVLKHARVLYGVNPFSGLGDPDPAMVHESIFRKVAEYALAMRRAYIESNRERTTAQNYQIISRLLKMVRDVLWLGGIFHVHERSEESVAALRLLRSDLLTADEWELLQQMANPRVRGMYVGDMSEDFFQRRIGVAEKLYGQAVLWRFE